MTNLKVIQVRRREKNNTFYFSLIGIVKVLNSKIDLESILEDIWNVCNVSSWANTDLWKLTRRITTDTLTMTITDEFTGTANSDIIITDGKHINFTAETFNWKSHPSLKDAKRHTVTKDLILL